MRESLCDVKELVLIIRLLHAHTSQPLIGIFPLFRHSVEGPLLRRRRLNGWHGCGWSEDNKFSQDHVENVALR